MAATATPTTTTATTATAVLPKAPAHPQTRSPPKTRRPASAAAALPLEVLDMVFRCLLAAAAPSLSPLAAAALVCVHWNAAATPRLYNSLHLLAGARLARLVVSLSAAWQHRLAAFQRLPYPGTFVRSIEAGRPRRQLPDPLLSHYTALADPHADALADQARFIQLLTLLSTRPGGSLTHVRSVRLYAGWYRDFVLGQLAERCPDIETLETTAVDAGLARVLASLPRLHRLAVLLMDGDDLPVHLTGAESAAVSMFLPQTALRRESRVLVLRALQQLVIASSLSSLSSSEMDAAAAAGMGMGDAFVPCATNSVILNFRAPLLTRLVLSSVTVHTPDLTALLHRSPSIRHLAFTHIAGTTTPHTDHEDLLSAIAALPCLESLALHAPVRLGPFDLIDHLPPLSDTLTTLDLDSIAFEPLGYETWTARLSLSRLRLAGCAGVCLPADPRFLADLTLVRLDDISQTELRPLLATARSLCRLSLVDMPGITALAGLTPHPAALRSLVALDVQLCVGLAAPDVVAFAQSLPALQCLRYDAADPTTDPHADPSALACAVHWNTLYQ